MTGGSRPIGQIGKEPRLGPFLKERIYFNWSMVVRDFQKKEQRF